jgi:hypothetical protein
MSRYRPLKNYWIEVSTETRIEPGPNGSILVPPGGSKIFLHWLNDSGKMIATYTLEYATIVHSSAKVISKTPVRVHVIDL